jgi:hypothetical protein
MKKAFFVITAFFLSFHLYGQDIAMLSLIKTANGTIKTFEADLNETMVKPKTTINREGKLYFVSPKEFAALFSDGSCMIGNEKKNQNGHWALAWHFQIERWRHDAIDKRHLPLCIPRSR